MSQFQGIMNEYKNISLDRFCEENLKSTTYFLSHCHTDHMEGLGSIDFFNRLNNSKMEIKLYTSKINSDILENDNKYKHLSPFVVIIEIDVPTIIKTPTVNNTGNEVTVTLLAAGHCPGSVMFLFEGNEGRVLYTGDFRWPINGAKRCRYLQSGDSIKNIQSLYLDTTFCVPNFLHIPNREVSCNALIEFSERCLSQNRNTVIHFILPAQYGYEYLFVELYNALKIKIHVDSNKISKFLDVDKITDAITENPCTRIHACYSRINTGFLPCGYSKGNMKLTTIKISAMWFERFPVINDPLVFDEKGKIYRLFYSTHSSLDEICDFVSHLKPKNIYPNVIPSGSSKKKVLEILNKYERNEINENGDSSQEIVALGQLSREQNSVSDSSQSTDLLFDVDLCSPIKKNLVNGNENSKCENNITKHSPDLIDLTNDESPLRNDDDDDCTADEFTPDPKSSPLYKLEKGNLNIIENIKVKRRKLIYD